MRKIPPNEADGSRGPADHVIRERIVCAASEHFSRYGYGKTTVSDLAKAIGFSKAYIYRFFESKQAIGEIIVAHSLAEIREEVMAELVSANSSTEKLRRLIKSMPSVTAELIFSDRNLFDIARYASFECWKPAVGHYEQLRLLVEKIVVEGRERGEFERKTPLDEVVRSIFYAVSGFADPINLERNLERMPNGPVDLAGLVLRSLAP